jgi:hypothetical protein
MLDQCIQTGLPIALELLKRFPRSRSPTAWGLSQLEL